jgi:hypothetical protein
VSRSHRQSSLHVLVLALAAIALLLAQPAQASFPGRVGQKIAFHSNRDGDADIYTTVPGNPTIATKLTNNTAVDENAKWSPDGTKIVFDSGRDGNLEIYVMNADGTGQTRLTNNAAFDWEPAWSGDGTKIVFASGRDDTDGDIYTMNADGSGVTRLTTDTNRDQNPNWSPDGTKIAWTSSRVGNQYDIFTMNADGTSQTQRTTDPSSDVTANWSPDGTKIAFATNRDGNFEIYWMNPDGTAQVARFASTPETELSPAFQPDWLAGTGGVLFTRYTSGDVASDIYRLSAPYTNGSSLSAIDEAADWQPLNNSYARPRGATPVRIALVPAYAECVPNTNPGPPVPTHRGALSKESCYAPTPLSTYLTVGSPEFNGVGANSQGSVTFRAATPANGLIDVSLTDVRCQRVSTGCSGGALADYSGSLLVDTNWRVTDKNNGPTGVLPSANGTVVDFPLSFGVPCATTASTTVGSTCSVSTSLDAVVGGATAVDDGKRAIWEMRGFADGTGVVKVEDGGADGVGTTAGNGLFEVGGLFFP